MPFANLVMSPRGQKEHSHSKVKAEIHDSKHNVK